MSKLNRHSLLAENIIREHIRKRIKASHAEKLLVENKVRQLIQNILKEADSDIAPHESTGINVLEDVLKKIIPILEQAYKRLTTSAEQRTSFRNHLIQAVKNTIKRGEALPGEEVAAESMAYEFDPSLFEDIVVNVGDEEEEDLAQGEFLDIESDDEVDDFTIAGEDETGRNFAQDTFDKIEKTILDSYQMLSDQEDQQLYYDYLLTNLMLYFDKFEDDLANQLPQITTPEYEEAKEEEPEEEPEEGAEEPEEEPAEDEEEPLI
tara:strand:+ start:1132 stop:1923 length:792 start_codon:yes stop_codon:yes gene_type:complete